MPEVTLSRTDQASRVPPWKARFRINSAYLSHSISNGSQYGVGSCLGEDKQPSIPRVGNILKHKPIGKRGCGVTARACYRDGDGRAEPE